jgi:hypothetical protein
MVACDDPTPFQRWSVSQDRMGATLLSDPSLVSNPAILESFSILEVDELVASLGSSDSDDALPASERFDSSRFFRVVS